MSEARAGLVTRLAAMSSLLVIAAVHLNLYFREEYKEIPTVGWLFLLTGISCVLLAVAVLVRPWWLIEASAALFSLGVLGGYLLTLLLPEGLFSFKEPSVSYSGAVSIAAEAAVVLLSALMLAHRVRTNAMKLSVVHTR